jgi:8-oxo-dGTP diphosphatase
MTVYLLRHGHAGRRSQWTGDDHERPLSKAGRRQAKALVAQLGNAPIEYIVSSPYVRCRQSVEPLAQHLRLPVDLSDVLAEGAPLTEVLQLMDKVSDREAVLCTHGNVVEALLRHYARQHVPGIEPTRNGKPPMDKGAYWALDFVDGTATSASYCASPVRA